MYVNFECCSTFLLNECHVFIFVFILWINTYNNKTVSDWYSYMYSTLIIFLEITYHAKVAQKCRVTAFKMTQIQVSSHRSVKQEWSKS